MKFSGTYSVNGGSPEPARISFLPEKLSIHLLQQAGPDRIVYWYYEQVAADSTADRVFVHLDHPPQVIHFADREPAAELNGRIKGSRKKIITKRRSTSFKVFGGLLLFFIIAFFWFVPWIAGIFANRFPVDYEKQMGDQMFASMKETLEIDAAKTVYLNQFFDALRVPSAYNIRITVVQSSETNAFAMPGGHIVVYDRLLEGLRTYPELAALLMHEFVHVQHRHSLKSLFRNLSSSLFFALVIGDASAVGNVLINNAGALKNLSYSRRLEREADEEGSRLLAQRKIDCNGFVRLFQFLQQENKVEKSEWASSHPDLQKRIDNIRENRVCKQQNADHHLLETLFGKIKNPS